MTSAVASMQDRFRGALLGLAVGDALGSTLEFTRPGAFLPITEMVGGGPFGLKPGQWTDDTSLALCLAESLVTCEKFDVRDQIERYVRWYRKGHLSSTGTCFDIGNTVAAALRGFERTGEPLAGPIAPLTAGNGSLMRLAPVPLAFWPDAARAIALAGESSRTTHGIVLAVDACRYFAALLVGVLQGRSKEEILRPLFDPTREGNYWAENPLAPEINAIALGSFKEKDPPEIRGTGYVVESLEAALWAFHGAASFREGVLAAVNLGEDADTTGAVYGQLAGAYYGVGSLPADWVAKLAMLGKIQQLADGLLVLASRVERQEPVVCEGGCGQELGQFTS
ncbi:MAG TPA: ADP-ribosylglycohydrolase family protein [Chthoniobacterales bacterium]